MLKNQADLLLDADSEMDKIQPSHMMGPNKKCDISNKRTVSAAGNGAGDRDKITKLGGSIDSRFADNGTHLVAADNYIGSG